LVELAVVTVDENGLATLWPDAHDASGRPFITPTRCPQSDAVSFPPFSG